MQGTDKHQVRFTIRDFQVEKALDAVSEVGKRLFSTSPFYHLKNPQLQVLGGLAALGYGIYQIGSQDGVSRIGLSVGGLILYQIRWK